MTDHLAQLAELARLVDGIRRAVDELAAALDRAQQSADNDNGRRAADESFWVQ